VSFTLFTSISPTPLQAFVIKGFGVPDEVVDEVVVVVGGSFELSSFLHETNAANIKAAKTMVEVVLFITVISVFVILYQLDILPLCYPYFTLKKK
jgi:hypothetical protein